MSEWMLAHPIMTFILAFFAIDGARAVFQDRARARLIEAKSNASKPTNGGDS
jgi:hypothetical protein